MTIDLYDLKGKKYETKENFVARFLSRDDLRSFFTSHYLAKNHTFQGTFHNPINGGKEFITAYLVDENEQAYTADYLMVITKD